MSSASLRVYCGQLAASKQTLKDLGTAIDLVKDIAPNDPTRGYVDSNVQRWSLAILRLAEASYQEGNYTDAVNAAKKVPSNIPAYKSSPSDWDNGKKLGLKELLSTKKLEHYYIARNG